MHESDLSESSRWRFSDSVPTVDAAYCLNSRHKAASCTRCAAACPIQAIFLTDSTPSLDAERCVNCGVCQVACPTDVFQAPYSVEAKLVETVSQTTADVLLVCPLNATPDLTAAPVEVVVRHKRCLAALSASDLLELAQQEKRAIWLDDSPCATCPLSATHPTLHATVAFTQSLLHALDLQAHIELYSGHPELANVKPERHPLLDGMQPKISRRRLFGLADRITREPIVQDSGDEPASPEGNRLPQRVPLSHRRLLEQLRRISTKREELFAASVAFADVQIDEQACSACALCAHFCPTAALQFDVSEQKFAINFSANRCIGCNLCQIACPEDAIQISDTLTLERLFAQDDQVLITGDLVPCTRCRAHTAGRDGQHLCHSCRHGAGLVTSLRDDAGLMTDLLSRITPMHQTNT